MEIGKEEDWAPDLLDYYHGTAAENLPLMCAHGIKPVIGAGSDYLLTFFGMAVPAVYVAESLKVATTYPIYETTGQVEVGGSSYKAGLPGGTLLAEDGSYPMRAVLRFVALPQNKLWNRGHNQTAFMPQDLFCTHMILYAVSPMLVHQVHIQRTSLDNLPQVDWCEIEVRGGMSTEADHWVNSAPSGSMSTEAWSSRDEAGRIFKMLHLLKYPDFVKLCPDSCA